MGPAQHHSLRRRSGSCHAVRGICGRIQRLHQLTSPRAGGLFAGAIIQSGACTAPAQNEPRPLAEAAGEELAKDIGCGAATDVPACLRSVPPYWLARTVSHRLGALGPNSWGAVVGTPVLPRSAADAFATGAYAKVPVMLGVNHDEGRLFGLFQLATGRLWSTHSYRRLLQREYGREAAALEARFPVTQDRAPSAAYAAMITEQTFACPAVETARLLIPRTPVWLYEFDDPDAITSIPNVLGAPALGAAHATEIAYILQRPWILADPARLSAAQRALSDRMQAAWGAFARTGAPIAPGDASWPVYPSIQRLAPSDARARASVFQPQACDG